MNTEQIDLHDFIQNGSYQNAFICSYTFETDFFENYCLEKFQSLKTNKNINILIDHKTYHKIINSKDLPKLANVRYLLLPIKVKGAFHPKIFLFTNKGKGKLVIGSANFTEPGITSNAELVSCFEFKENEKEEYKQLFIQAFQFLEDIATNSKNNTLKMNLSEALKDSPWLRAKENNLQNNLSVNLISNLEKPLWEQIISYKNSEVNNIYIVSRFFDSHPNNLISRIQNDLNTSSIKIYTQNKTTTLNSDWLNHEMFHNDKLKIFLCRYSKQTLHAKAYAIEYKDNSYTFAFGSANFTTPALLKTCENGNLETMIIFENLLKKDLNPDKLFDPQNTKVILKNADDLITATNPDDEVIRDYYDFQLIEASIIEDKVNLKIEKIERFANKKYKAVIMYSNEIKEKLLASPTSYENLKINIPEYSRYLLKKSCVIQLEVYDENNLIGKSNKILLTNLIDINTSEGTLRSRYLSNAEQNPEQFNTIFKELIDSNDETALIYFLNNCNINLNPVFSGSSFLSISPDYKVISDGIRRLKNLNFDNLRDIHSAAKFFLDRHIKKLESHTKELRGVSGIENFLQIQFAILETIYLLTQMLLEELNSLEDPIFTPNEWSEYKSIVYLYYEKLETVLKIFSEKYLPKLLKRVNIEKVKTVFNNEILNKIFTSSELTLSILKNIMELREDKLAVRSIEGKIIKPAPDPMRIVPFRFNLIKHIEFEENQRKKLKEITSLFNYNLVI